MTPLSECWMVMADGAHFRLLEERRRHGEIVEMPAWPRPDDMRDREDDKGRRFIEEGAIRERLHRLRAPA